MKNDLIRISVSHDHKVDYSPSRGMYRVSLFEKGHYVDEIWFDAYEDKEVKDKEDAIQNIFDEIPIFVAPNSVDLSLFYKKDRNTCRKKFEFIIPYH